MHAPDANQGLILLERPTPEAIHLVLGWNIRASFYSRPAAKTKHSTENVRQAVKVAER